MDLDWLQTPIKWWQLFGLLFGVWFLLLVLGVLGWLWSLFNIQGQ